MADATFSLLTFVLDGDGGGDFSVLCAPPNFCIEICSANAELQITNEINEIS